MSEYHPHLNPNRIRYSTIFPGLRRQTPPPDRPTALSEAETRRLRVRRQLANSGHCGRSPSPRGRSPSPVALPRRVRDCTLSRTPPPPLRLPRRSPPTGRTRIRPAAYRDYACHVRCYGSRRHRAEYLSELDLYIDGIPPTDQPTDERTQDLQCGICYNAKSHPVFYPCGHGHCYACIRMALERSFKCPECRQRMMERPHRRPDVEAAIESAFPEWNNPSRVDYSWKGLTFPKPHIVTTSDEELGV
ncbi:hypothetical protein B0H11DRAFT_2259808 [Mycena galericulata]|nr:hypothetical protein B0H11DRAFT_2259808 [Mycena galericulata]